MAKPDKENQVIDEVPEKVSESSENIEAPVEAQPEPPKQYIHVDQFLLTAVPLYGLNNMQAAGFKVHMTGRHYQYDVQVFVQELKQYLNLK